MCYFVKNKAKAGPSPINFLNKLKLGTEHLANLLKKIKVNTTQQIIRPLQGNDIAAISKNLEKELSSNYLEHSKYNFFFLLRVALTRHSPVVIKWATFLVLLALYLL